MKLQQKQKFKLTIQNRYFVLFNIRYIYGCLCGFEFFNCHVKYNYTRRTT